MATFCTRTGSLVTLSNACRIARRNHPAQEFNNGVVISAEPLNDNQLFEVKIDKKVNYFAIHNQYWYLGRARFGDILKDCTSSQMLKM